MPNQIEQMNFLDYVDAAVRDCYARRATELRSKMVEKNNLIDEPIARYTSTGLPVYQSDDPGEMYRYKNKALLDGILFKDQKIVGRTVYVSNGLDGKNYKAGFLDGEIIVKRLMDDKNRKWPQKRNMRPYKLLTPAKYHFTIRDQMIDRGFKPGETIWIPSGCELKINGDRKKERIEQIIRGC